VVSAFDPTREATRRFFGAWRYLGSFIDGKLRPGRGAHPRGVIIYDASGMMAVHITPDRPRSKAGPEPTGEEAQNALAGVIAYFGTYTIDEQAGTVTHHRTATVQPGDGGDVVRAYEFRGDRLILRPVGGTHEIMWERVK
jgi:hypothetical protein